ncbi:urease accessory protein UreF [Mycobacterium sp. MUNTM1]
MTEDLAALLASLQLADSAFPSGFYTLSHGLEGYAQARAIEPSQLPRLLEDLLRNSVGPSGATAMAIAHRGASCGHWDEVVAVDRRLYATMLNREMRMASTRTGRQLLDVARESFGGNSVERFRILAAEHKAPVTQPVVAGVVYADAGAPVASAVASELFAFATSFAGAAVRLRLSDHIRAQRLLRDVVPVIAEVARQALSRPLAELGACAPLADVMSGRHERADARLFAT